MRRRAGTDLKWRPRAREAKDVCVSAASVAAAGEGAGPGLCARRRPEASRSFEAFRPSSGWLRSEEPLRRQFALEMFRLGFGFLLRTAAGCFMRPGRRGVDSLVRLVMGIKKCFSVIIAALLSFQMLFVSPFIHVRAGILEFLWLGKDYHL